MSDFRFKISGDSRPFVAELYDASTNNLVASQVVEYSGLTTSYPNHTCVIFDGLTENTSYYAKIIDSVGKTISSISQSTPSNPVIVPTNVNVNLLGTYYSPSPSVCVINEPKYIEISPMPQIGQCAVITLSGTSCYGDTDDAYVKVYKRCGNSGSYNLEHSIINSSNNFDVTICSGDDICYEMVTVIDHPNSGVECLSYACAKLEITNVSVSGYTNPTISIGSNCLDISQTCCTTTTTTTSTLPPVNVYFDNIITSSQNYGECKSANLVTDPPLTPSQSFRVCFELTNRYDICEQLSTSINQEGCVTQGPNTVVSQNTLGIHPSTCTKIISGYADVNSNNINKICLCSKAISDIANFGCSFSECQRICICEITNMVGGNYVYNIPGYPSCLQAHWSGNLQPQI